MRCSFCNQGPFGDVGEHEAYCDQNPDRALEDPDGPGTNLMTEEDERVAALRCDNEHCINNGFMHTHKRGDMTFCCPCTGAFDMGLKQAGWTTKEILEFGA